MNIPLIDECKREFVVRRVLQTFLGGAKLKLGYKAPLFVYLLQVLLLTFPCLIGIVFVVLTETRFLVFPQYMYSYGTVMFTFVMLVQIVSRNSLRKVSHASEIKKKSTVLSQDDEIEFDSCFSSETIQFVSPPKKHLINVLFHGLVSAVMCGLAIHYLLPTVIQSTWRDSTACWIMMLLGWFSLCVAQFPLTTNGAPEPAVYRPLDTYEITAVSRAFYVIIILSVFSSQIGKSGIYVSYGMYVHLLLAILPLLWCMNILPPIDVLISWFGEQVLCHVIAGSPQMSNFRLFIMIILPCSMIIVVRYIPIAPVNNVIMVTMGGLLSVDIGLVFEKIRKSFSNALLKRVTKNFDGERHSTWQSVQLSNLAIHVILTVTSAILCVFDHLLKWSNDTNSLIRDVSGYCLFAIWLTCLMLSSLQSGYLFFGTMHNPLYPSSCFNLETFKKKKRSLRWLGTARSVLVKIGLLSAILYITALNHETSDTRHTSWLYIIALARAYRSVWQNTLDAILDMFIFHALYFWFEFTSVKYYHPFVALMIIATVRVKLVEMLHKLYVVVIITVTSVTLSKQRLWYNWWLVGLDIIFSPVILVIVIVSSIISAPLLPLFTLPFFLFSFPRPVKMWPNIASAGKCSSDVVCTDAVYYKQLAPRLSSCLAQAAQHGSLGCVRAGDHYILRFEDRMVWVQILEHGYNYLTLVMKGLELQETSCHTVEAAELDVIFEQAFNYSDNKRCVNGRCYNSVTPLDTVVVKSYSDTKNILTGVIDSPETLRFIPSYFPKIFSFILLNYSVNCVMDQVSIVSDERRSKERKPSVHSLRSTDKLMIPDAVILGSDCPRLHTVDVQVEGKWADNVLDSSWSDEDDPLDEVISKRNSATYLTSLSSMRENSGIPGCAEIDDQIMMCEWRGAANKTNDSPELKETILLDDPPPITQSDHNEYLRYGLKPSWLNTPREKVAKCDHLSLLWLQDALNVVLDDDQCLRRNIASHFCNPSIMLSYHNIVNCCYRAFFGENGNVPDPANVYRTFLGDLQWSLTAEWLRQNDDLMMIALQAYRYSVKFAIDKALLTADEFKSNKDMYEQTKSLMTDWFVGPDNSKAWNQAIQLEKQNLFSLGHNTFQNIFTGHLLSLQELPVHIGKLNAQMVRAIWASLNFELLYLTNDDEERYSIQAHPVILRNLTVQAADPPLGYPLYISSPITMYI